MLKAFGAPMIHSESVSEDEWHGCWSAVVHLKGNLYTVLGGSIGRKYVDQLSLEVSQLVAKN